MCDALMLPCLPLDGEASKEFLFRKRTDQAQPLSNAAVGVGESSHMPRDGLSSQLLCQLQLRGCLTQSQTMPTITTHRTSYSSTNTSENTQGSPSMNESRTRTSSPVESDRNEASNLGVEAMLERTASEEVICNYSSTDQEASSNRLNDCCADLQNWRGQIGNGQASAASQEEIALQGQAQVIQNDTSPDSQTPEAGLLSPPVQFGFLSDRAEAALLHCYADPNKDILERSSIDPDMELFQGLSFDLGMNLLQGSSIDTDMESFQGSNVNANMDVSETWSIDPDMELFKGADIDIELFKEYNTGLEIHLLPNNGEESEELPSMSPARTI